MYQSLISFTAALLLISCSDTHNLKERVDDLTVRTANNYKPGFGEFMTNIQIHHAKLWFAGTDENWPLADFETGEISETVDAIQKYETDRPESKELPVILPALDSVRTAIQKKDRALFVTSFHTLTATCNTCHRAVKFGFNVVKIPDTPPFSNQDFSVRTQ